MIGFVEFLTEPISWWLEPFAFAAMQRALIAGLLVVISTSLVGTWVVLRGMSFLGDALAHGVLPGVAIAYVLGVDTTLGAVLAAIVMMLGLQLLEHRSPLPEETSIGVLFVGFLAAAVVVMSSDRANYIGDLNRFLFGSVVGLQTSDLVRQAVAAVLAVIGVTVFYRPFLVMTFSRTKATLLGLRPRLAHAVLLGLLGMSIVSSFQTVGNLLVFAFLIAPPAAAALVVTRVPMIMLTSLLIGAFSVVLGLLLSYHYATAAGATMALVAVGVFFVLLLARPPKRPRAH